MCTSSKIELIQISFDHLYSYRRLLEFVVNMGEFRKFSQVVAR